jgi:MipA family protein
MTRKALALALLTVASGGPALAGADIADDQAAPLPLWEVGLGLGGLAAPAYLGSAVTRSYLSPWPYLVYRGDKLKANREGLSIGLLDTHRLSLDLSVSGALPAKSQGTAREGMPDLPLAIEGGAVLKIALFDHPTGHLAFRLPLRHASGVDRNGVQNIGWIMDPTLRWTRRVQWWDQTVDVGLDLSAKFQDRRYNNFYYQVSSGQATATRPAYTASGGYSGSTLNVGGIARRGTWGFGAFMGLSDLSGARFTGSPLIEKTFNWYGGFTLFWVFQQSKELASQAPPL